MSDRPFGPGIIPPGADVSSLWDTVASALSSAKDQAIDTGIEGLDYLGHQIRYGMGPAELRQRINEGAAPGATPNPGLDRDDQESRRAAAYYFAKRWPKAAPMVQGAVNSLRDARTIPGFTGMVQAPNPFADEGTPEQRAELYRIANEASQRGVADAFSETRYALGDTGPDLGVRYASAEDE